MTLEQLETKLTDLRSKWKGRVPKSSMDKTWWEFNCDKVRATGLITQINKIKNFEEELLKSAEH